MIEIEYETLSTTTKLINDLNIRPLEKLNELKAIEEKNQELKLQLAANEEIK